MTIVMSEHGCAQLGQLVRQGGQKAVHGVSYGSLVCVCDDLKAGRFVHGVEL
jgi:hypothetical protein